MRGGFRTGSGRPKGTGKFGEATKPLRVPESLVDEVLAFVANRGEPLLASPLPLYTCAVSAGFPSPADDYVEKTLDLNEHLIKNPPATFFVKVTGDSMVDAGIFDGDLLVVDRSLEPRHHKVVVAALDGQLTVKRLYKKAGEMWLMPENSAYEPIEVTAELTVTIWGVVTNVIHSL